ncbi:hypothetical protein PAPYR_10219 [Paratrimastix pyriformis]|uniref:ParB/Sulfiredoxin domain-containing protein n=1 Tax=Paratrimastix pyriformis TaxID=342808 RepID=A0ABQ8U996_9EUKA|nr:hypothetical protein PAPYR_10219 [Paratrimastix pyriformis]
MMCRAAQAQRGGGPPSPEGSRGPEEAEAAPVAAKSKEAAQGGEAAAPAPPPARRKPGPPLPSASEPDRPTRTTSPRRPLAKYCTSPGLAYERLGAIVEWFEKLGAAVLFSIIVQTSALDEARYQVVDGSHRFQVARIIVDAPGLRVAEITQNSGPSFAKGWRSSTSYPDPAGLLHVHLKDYIDVAVYNSRSGGHARAATSGQPAYSRRAVWKQHLRRPAEPQACIPPSPKRYIREDPDCHIWNPPSRAALPQRRRRPGQSL